MIINLLLSFKPLKIIVYYYCSKKRVHMDILNDLAHTVDRNQNNSKVFR